MIKGFVILFVLAVVWSIAIVLSGGDGSHRCGGCNRCFRREDGDSDLR